MGSNWRTAKGSKGGSILAFVESEMCDSGIGVDGKDQCDSRGPDSGTLNGVLFFAKNMALLLAKTWEMGREIGPGKRLFGNPKWGSPNWVRRAQDFSRIKGRKVTRLSAW